MDFRVEHKYLVPETLREALRRAILPFVRPDRHATPKHDAVQGEYLGYTVRSIYYDSASFEHYFQNENGLAIRAKPRIRSYDDKRADSLAFLEVKRRNGAVGSKSRAPIPFDGVPTLLESGDVEACIANTAAFPSAEDHARHFLFRVMRNALRPVVLVTYDREPYVGTIEPSLRLTLDTRIRSIAFPDLANLFADRGFTPSLPGHFIFEVKHDSHFGFPVWLRPFMAKHGLVRRALSKYYTCLFDQNVVQAHSNIRGLARAEWTPTRSSRARELSPQAFYQEETGVWIR